jgi:hydroxymethylpyrimidine kinase/phosphomethylpyrimidine kinase
MTVALSIAGSDSIGGAGIQADLKVFAAMGVHGTSVITSVTSQNTVRVKGIFPLTPAQVLSQLDAVLEDVKVSAAKTGMLYSSAISAAVAKRLAQETFPLVVDPVMVAGVGDRLDDGDLARSLKNDLIPRATLVMPNRHEAEILTDSEMRTIQDAEEACRAIAGTGAGAVLIKGGHFTGSMATDLLFSAGEFVEVSSPRLNIHPHGAGCTFSALITAHLASGLGVKEAVIASKSRMVDSLLAHYAPGMGLVVLDQLATLRREAERYPVLTELRRGLEELEPMLTSRWIPKGGIEAISSLPHPRGFQDLVGIEADQDARPKRIRCLVYGASGPTAQVLLTANRSDTRIRTALALKFSGRNLEDLSSSGLNTEPLEEYPEAKIRTPMDKSTEDAIRRRGIVPDVIFDRGDAGQRQSIWVLGSDPVSVTLKMRRALS